VCARLHSAPEAKLRQGQAGRPEAGEGRGGDALPREDPFPHPEDVGKEAHPGEAEGVGLGVAPHPGPPGEAPVGQGGGEEEELRLP
jgi:hypothetical protein